MRTCTVEQLLRDLRNHPEITGFEQLFIEELDQDQVNTYTMEGEQFQEIVLSYHRKGNLDEPLATVHDLLMFLKDKPPTRQIRFKMRGNMVLAPQIGVWEGKVYLFGL